MRALPLLLLVAALAACPPLPVPPPNPDASDAMPPVPMGDALPPPSTPCEAACAALRGAGCSEGAALDCARVLGHLDGQRIVRTPSGVPLTCAAVATVHTHAEARAQGIACEP